ncbi:MAG TPA: glycoside hydrolase family 5 protein [Terriglobales bacterium]
MKINLGFATLAIFLSAHVVSAQSSLPSSRLAHLRHGINTSSWFAQVYDSRGYTKEHFETWTTAEDVALIKSMGFDHVRLSVNPEPMFRNKRPDEIPADYLGYLDAGVKMILNQGLAVIIDMHPDSDFKARLNRNEDDFVQQFADYWRAVARHYSTLDPDRVFFEVLNEPEFTDRNKWYGVQAKLAAAIREGAPQNTIIVAGANWSDDDDLLSMEPLRDPNLIYNFHFYDPHIFTHQGATWGAYNWHWVRKLPYPSTPEAVEAAAENVPVPLYRLFVIRYGLDRWNAERMDVEIRQVAEWARRWHVPVTCNEFGVFRQYSDPKDRAAWISDFRQTLEKYGIGWAMWDYAGGFGVVTKKDGGTAPDDLILRSLGLK